MLTAGQAWQMAGPIFQYKHYATNHLLVIMNTFARGQISIGTQTGSV